MTTTHEAPEKTDTGIHEERLGQPEYRAHLRKLCEAWSQGSLFPEAEGVLATVAAPALMSTLSYIENLLDELHVESFHSMKLAKLCYYLESERSQTKVQPKTSSHVCENSDSSLFQRHELQRDETVRLAQQEVRILYQSFADKFTHLLTSISPAGEWGVELHVQERSCGECCGVTVHLEPGISPTVSHCWTCTCASAPNLLANCFDFARMFIANFHSNQLRTCHAN